MVRAYNSVSSEISLIVYESVHIHTLHAFIRQYPQETTDTTRMAAHHFPVIIQAGTMASVVQTVQEFSRHKDFRQAHVVLTFSIRTIVHGFETGEVTLRMDDRAFLRIVFMEFSVQFNVPAFFITIAPPDNGRMVHITFYHAFNQTYSRRGVVLTMPATQFIHNIESKRVACFQKFRVRRIVAQTDRIHIHALHQKYIFNILRFTQGTTAFGTETMTVDTTHIDTHPVHVQSVTFTNFDSTETECLGRMMQDFTFFIQQ